MFAGFLFEVLLLTASKKYYTEVYASWETNDEIKARRNTFSLFSILNFFNAKDHTFITPTRKKVGRGVLEVYHESSDSYVSKQQIYCLFLQIVEGGRSKNWSFFVNVMKT